jgi:L-cysteine:1D-myo-inositol 2-amino-2-deoxy-alpha-D-glucopyranoside ligase
VEWIERLRSVGSVYEVDGDLYFSASSESGFGTIAALTPERMREIFAERGGDPDRPGKRTPLDCLLWQAARPDEPAWDTPLGHGRPGWHIECTAIALDHLDMAFDVQGGGSDLAFPHHEMCSAQAITATGRRPFAQHFVHTGMVGLEGHKMSKSRGNLVFVSKLRGSGVEPAAIRLALLAHHYRSDWEWTDAARGWPTTWMLQVPLPWSTDGPMRRWPGADRIPGRPRWLPGCSTRFSGWTSPRLGGSKEAPCPTPR